MKNKKLSILKNVIKAILLLAACFGLFLSVVNLKARLKGYKERDIKEDLVDFNELLQKFKESAEKSGINGYEFSEIQESEWMVTKVSDYRMLGRLFMRLNERWDGVGAYSITLYCHKPEELENYYDLIDNIFLYLDERITKDQACDYRNELLTTKSSNGYYNVIEFQQWEVAMEQYRKEIGGGDEITYVITARYDQNPVSLTPYIEFQDSQKASEYAFTEAQKETFRTLIGLMPEQEFDHYIKKGKELDHYTFKVNETSQILIYKEDTETEIGRLSFCSDPEDGVLIYVQLLLQDSMDEEEKALLFDYIFHGMDDKLTKSDIKDCLKSVTKDADCNGISKLYPIGDWYVQAVLDGKADAKEGNLLTYQYKFYRIE